MRGWRGLVVGVVLASACQQAGLVEGDGDGGPQNITTDGGRPDGGPTDGGSGEHLKHPDWPPPRNGYVNPIPAENQRAGDPSWDNFTRSSAGQLEAYADRVSAKAGDTVTLMVRAASGASNANWTLY